MGQLPLAYVVEDTAEDPALLAFPASLALLLAQHHNLFELVVGRTTFNTPI